jgi:hypothetical protein
LAKPVNVGEVCQFVPSLLYCAPDTVTKVTVVEVFDKTVGAAGAAWVYFANVDTVTPPLAGETL